MILSRWIISTMNCNEKNLVQWLKFQVKTVRQNVKRVCTVWGNQSNWQSVLHNFSSDGAALSAWFQWLLILMCSVLEVGRYSMVRSTCTLLYFTLWSAWTYSCVPNFSYGLSAFFCPVPIYPMSVQSASWIMECSCWLAQVWNAYCWFTARLCYPGWSAWRDPGRLALTHRKTLFPTVQCGAHGRFLAVMLAWLTKAMRMRSESHKTTVNPTQP